ncbi:MAG: helix-turn-helix transcriptional regulator [Coriobacteriales bacterium]|nr:helix-turn-helix transcriptional regulator [Coriobacteriales bacterium]
MEFSKYSQLLGHHIQEIRRSRHLTQEQVAELIGMDRASIGYIEQGRRVPKISTLFSLAEIYDIEMQDFFAIPTSSREDEPTE